MESKFVIGDKVKIIGYGSLLHYHKKNSMFYKPKCKILHEDEDRIVFDMNSEIVGRVGIIAEVTETQGRMRYAIDGIPEKSAWYEENQIEMVNANPNRDIKLYN